MNLKIKLVALAAGSLFISTGLHTPATQAQTEHLSSQESIINIGGITSHSQNPSTPQVAPGHLPIASFSAPGANAGDIPALGAYYDARNPGGINLGTQHPQRGQLLKRPAAISQANLAMSPVDQKLQNWQIQNNQTLLTEDAEDADDADPLSPPVQQTLLWLAISALAIGLISLAYKTYSKQQQPFN